MQLFVIKGDAAKVRTLLSAPDAQSFFNFQAENGYTPLHFAAQKGHASVTTQLLEARCNVNLQLKDGCTPLHLAAEFGHEAVTKQLLAAHCNVDLQNNNGFTAVQTA